MLDDKNTMDDINPFLEFMPGTSRQPHAFGKYTETVNEPEEELYKSPACDIVSKNVGRPGYREENCSLSRPLLPGRNIDKGFTNPRVIYVSENAENIVEKVENYVENAKTTGETVNFTLNLISLVSLILLIVMF
jgi:hypothetical protein